MFILSTRMSLPFFLARRFYGNAGGDRRRRVGLPAIKIATAGVAVGLAVMIVSVCVVKGFQSEIRANLSGFTAHMEVLDLNSFTSPESYPVVTDSALISAISSVSGVERVGRVSLKMGIIKTNDAFQTIILKGVGKDYDLNFLKSRMVEGRLPAWGADSVTNEIVISQRQARALDLKVGSRVYTYFIADDIKLRRFTVTGIYETNLSQFDDYFVWTDRATVNKLNNWQDDQSSALEIHVDDYDHIDAVQAGVGRLVNGRTDGRGGVYATLSVKENPRTASVIQWLTLLDFNVWVILALMVGVAGFTMISGLLILILERTQTIGVLKALGMTNTRIRHTFIAYAVLIMVRGLAWGNIIGLGIVGAQKLWGWVKLDPTTYYVAEVPVEMAWWWVVGLNAGTLLVCTLALVVPSFVISHIRPAKSIRFE